MKRILPLFLSFILSYSVSAQLELVPDPCDINSGTLTIKYGELADYSIFDPFSDPNLYIYSGLETDGNASTWDYHDDWNDTATLIPLTYDSGLGYYVATFNPATRTYIEEATMTTVNIPVGTQVNDWYFIIRNLPGDRQSSDLAGSAYGFTSASVLSRSKYFKLEGIHPLKGALLIEEPDVYNITIHNIIGQTIASQTIRTTSAFEKIDLELESKGIYVISLTKENKKATVLIRN